MTSLFSNKRRVLLLLIMVIILAITIKIMFFSTDEQDTYLTVPVKKSDIELTVLADGSIKSAKMVSVGAQVSGQIKALRVKLNEKVTKGQIIAEIDDLPQQNNLKEAQATLKNLQAQRASKQATLLNNQATFTRYQNLVNKGGVSKAEYDVAKANLDANKADIDALDAQIAKAEISVSTAELNLGYTKIASPIDGIVVAIPVEEGQTLNAVQSAPTILKVADLDNMIVEAQISEADVTKVGPNMAAYFTILGQPNKRYPASLREIEPAPTSINSETTTTASSAATNAIFYNGLLDVKNTEDHKLRISMTAQVYIILKQVKDALIVPVTAVSNMDFENNGQVQVVNDKGEVSTRDVKTGINNNINIEIVSGVKEGEQVIISNLSGDLAPATNSRRVRVRM